MRINGTKRERIEVEINELEVVKELWDRWIFRLHKGNYIRDGFWYEEFYTSHAWDSKKDKATEEEIQIFNAFQTVYDVVKEQA